MHNRFSKLITKPEFHVIDVSSRCCFFQEPAGVKYAVVGLKISVPVNLVTDFGARPVADEPGTTAVGRHEQEPRYGVYAVVQVFPLLDY